MDQSRGKGAFASPLAVWLSIGMTSAGMEKENKFGAAFHYPSHYEKGFFGVVTTARLGTVPCSTARLFH